MTVCELQKQPKRCNPVPDGKSPDERGYGKSSPASAKLCGACSKSNSYLDRLIASFGALIPFIKTKLDVVLFHTFPFHLLKGIGVSVVPMLLSKRLTPILKGRQN